MGKDEMAHLFGLLEASLVRQGSKWVASHYHNNGYQNLIGADERRQTVSWMLSTSSDKLHFNRDTSFLAVAILDAFLRSVKAQPKYLKCMGISCIYIAAKINEEDDVLPSTGELLEMSACGCSSREICRMEFCILDTLQWDANLPTSLHFLQLFWSMLLSKCKDIFPGRMHIKYLHYMSKVLEHCLLEACFVSYEPCTLALCVLSCQLRLLWCYWNTLDTYLCTILRIDEKLIKECCTEIENRFSDVLLASIRLPNKKLMRGVGKRGAVKRKVEEEAEEEDYDLYEGIKRLYGDDSNSAFDNNTSASNNNTTNNNNSTCSSEVAKFSGRLLGLKHGKAL